MCSYHLFVEVFKLNTSSHYGVCKLNRFVLWYFKLVAISTKISKQSMMTTQLWQYCQKSIGIILLRVSLSGYRIKGFNSVYNMSRTK